ncbi:GtrA family protein [Enterobacter sp.]|uniref:GtrA family protein n=1 Tax=Enterobacter sp. TaxID=42895 RepID=UPI00296FB338|nr:GtrA family protein [Enterobacter sp.]
MKIRTSCAYLCISGSCFLGHNAIMIVAESAGAALWLAILLSFVTTVTAGYILHSVFTFKQPLSLRAFGRYAASMSLNIPLVFACTGFWYHWLEFPMPVAAPLASLCMLVLNFFLSRWAISASGRKRPYRYD